MRFRLRTLLIVLALLPPLLAIGQDKSDPGAAVIGEWEVVEMVYNATVQDFGGESGGWFIFEKASFFRVFDVRGLNDVRRGKMGRGVPYIIRPKEIDFLPRPQTNEVGVEEAIWEIRDGKLRVAWREGIGPRPTDFDDAYKDRRVTLFVLKKVK
jgi:hypothetical protein